MEATWRWGLITAIAPITWGSTYYVTREFLPSEYPLFGAVIRALPAGALLLLVHRTLPKGAWWWKSAVLGFLNMGAFFALVYLAAQLLPTSVASVIMALAPLAMMAVAWPALAERPRVLPAIGACLGVTGVCAMVLSGSETLDASGVLASLAAMTMSSFGYVLAKRWAGEVKVLASTSWQLIAGGLLLLPLAIAIEGAPPALDPPAIVGFAYVSIVATGIAFAAWFTGLQHLTAARVGLIGLLNPITGVLLGTLAAREALTLLQLGGIALVLTGVMLGQTAPPLRRSRRESA